VVGVLAGAAVRTGSGDDAVEHIVGIDGQLLRAARSKVRPALLRDTAEAVILFGDPNGAAVKPLRIAGDLAVKSVEIDDANGTDLGDAIGSERRGGDEVSRTLR
jgi:hypothetical protein